MRGVQKLFLTATVLPFIIIGIAVLIRDGRWRVAAILFTVPVYYVCVQSALWSEFRYVLPMYYFLFALAAAGLHRAAGKLLLLASGRRKHSG